MSERPSWREEARGMTDAVPYVRSQRIRRRLRQRAEASTTRTRRHWSAMAAFAAGAALVLLSVTVLRPAQVQIAWPRLPAPAPSPVATAVTPPTSPALRTVDCDGDTVALAQGHTVALVGPCRVSAPGLQIVIADAATLGGSATAISLDAGEAELDVDPTHDRDAPFSVTTPAGRIEVTGTRFSVRHDDGGGALTLHEGRVRLISAGRVQHVVAGERVAWVAEGPRYRVVAPADVDADATDTAPAVEPAPTPGVLPKPRAHRPAPRASSAGALVETVERLRAAGEYGEAVTAIEAALPTLSRRDREVLSFELGKLIERSRGASAACTHWRSYAERFPKGRYADLVAEERTRLSCDAPSPSP